MTWTPCPDMMPAMKTSKSEALGEWKGTTLLELLHLWYCVYRAFLWCVCTIARMFYLIWFFFFFLASVDICCVCVCVVMKLMPLFCVCVGLCVSLWLPLCQRVWAGARWHRSIFGSLGQKAWPGFTPQHQRCSVGVSKYMVLKLPSTRLPSRTWFLNKNFIEFKGINLLPTSSFLTPSILMTRQDPLTN